MENRNGYAYGIWLLLRPCAYIPFPIHHKLHLTLISNIPCKRTAVKIYLRILQSHLPLPTLINTSQFPIHQFNGSPLSSIGWKVHLHNWKHIKERLEAFACGYVPEVPHISLVYGRGPIEVNSFGNHIDLDFTCHLVLVDMNDELPSNWKIL